MLKKLKNEYKKYEKMLFEAKEQIQLLPHGTLRCTSSNGSDQFFVDGQYIRKNNRDLVQEIAQRELLEREIPLIEARLNKIRLLLEDYESDYMHQLFNNQCPARKKILRPLEESMEERIRRFEAEVYTPLPFDANDTTDFYSEKRERMRSKSELLIARELLRHQIPYQYEHPLQLSDRGIITVYPDFTFMNISSGKIIIYEHFGMMDSMSYVGKCINKIRLYEKNGYLLGRDLIFTHETSRMPLSIGVVDAYLEEYGL